MAEQAGRSDYCRMRYSIFETGQTIDSRLQRAAAVITAGMSIQNFANSLYANGVNSSGAMEIDGNLSQGALAI
jgi:hypothetical protein